MLMPAVLVVIMFVMVEFLTLLLSHDCAIFNREHLVKRCLPKMAADLLSVFGNNCDFGRHHNDFPTYPLNLKA